MDARKLAISCTARIARVRVVRTRASVDGLNPRTYDAWRLKLETGSCSTICIDGYSTQSIGGLVEVMSLRGIRQL